MNLVDVIEGLVEERGLDKDKIVEIVCESINMVYSKKFPGTDFKVDFNQAAGKVEISVLKKVVSSVSDDQSEVSLRKAKVFSPSAKCDDIVGVPFDGQIGRIEIISVKQIIANKIRDLEQLAIFEEFEDKKDSIVTGVVHKRERSGYAVKISDTPALLPNENVIPGESIRVSHPIKALLREVYSVSRGDYQLILDRASADFVKKFLEIEIPEVFEKLVELKKVVRIPGYKTKIIVASTRSEIDPVGTCVGVGGARIKPILRELGREKIDLIQETDSIEQLVRDSLKPAEIDKVEVIDDNKVVVWLAPDQRSFAIGKMGQNIKLASKLVGLEIQLQDVSSQQGDLSLYVDEMEDVADVKNDDES